MKKTLLLSIFSILILSGCNPDESAVFEMSGPSMMPTYEEGDLLFVEEKATLDRGDVVVIKPFEEKEDRFVKRVIGLPGETVELVDGKVKIDGEFLEETYLSESSQNYTTPSAVGPSVFEIPEGSYFLLGDNRTKSLDSRSCFKDGFMGGCGDTKDYYITIEDVLGVVTN